MIHFVKNFVQSKEVVGGLLAKLGLDETHFALFHIWEREAGTWSEHAKAAGVRHGKLVVSVSSSACYQELKMRKASLLRALNGHFGKTIIRDIQFELKGCA